MNRRQALQSFLSTALKAAGTVVLASSAANAAAPGETPPKPRGDVKSRAELIAAELEPGEESEPCGGIFLNFNPFRNGGFNNGGFRNGGFNNGGFRNGGFNNGGFHNHPFHNHPFHNHDFHNHPFHNGGFRNGGFRNSGFRNW